MSASQMCKLVGVSRATYYRHRQPRSTARRKDDLDLRDAIQKLATRWPSYGSRRIHPELKKAGWTVSRKRVQRLMREDNLLVLIKRKFVMTTDSTHGLRTYPDVAAALQVTGLNQLWVADITYIRLE